MHKLSRYSDEEFVVLFGFSASRIVKSIMTAVMNDIMRAIGQSEESAEWHRLRGSIRVALESRSYFLDIIRTKDFDVMVKASGIE